MRKTVAMLGLALMAVGLILTMFGTQQATPSQQSNELLFVSNPSISEPGYPATIFVLSNPCTASCQIDGTVFVIHSSVEQISQPSFALNYVGMFLAVLGSIFFATSYPKKPSNSSPLNVISFGFGF